MSRYDYAPPEALRTPCVPGCDSTVQWEYDPGEASSYWHPGMPDQFSTVDGCTLEHLEMLQEYKPYWAVAGELYRQLDQWYQLELSARERERLSREYLGAKPRTFRSILDIDLTDEDI